MSGKQFFLDRIQAVIDADRERRQRDGWSFIEHDAEHHTVGDLVAAVMRIDRVADALRFYHGYLAWLTALPAESRSERYTPQQVARSNIGWCFGEGMDRDRIAMWHAVTGAAHPLFGVMDVTPDGAYRAGLKLGGNLRNA